ncbi:lasso peptide biosynthesis B2 protein [Sphingomonas sp. NSE70-1]|uniref:Lasso peptide biosynthesis B2 protein n=1 Tax=Sphingomonas caseinilyticus TaxID=2908205 RepID=A0ABT0RQT8_9SPHN|nr:lasso peptide biosynthesis B2 protein [Sphingomonas caseinilyticus]MCL6697382.1 lasso peptide biosynthesis B2 protein [Sphingomonas caseinilyticus]
MTLIERWRSKLRTGEAMMALCAARLLIGSFLFERWRHSLGRSSGSGPGSDTGLARTLAANVDWAARRIPFPTKCLPRAMALSWMLRRRQIDHAVVFAVRPEAERRFADPLHAWVEVAGEIVIGDLPGPWVETLRLGAGNPEGN